jgi:hypothetical protein
MHDRDVCFFRADDIQWASGFLVARGFQKQEPVSLSRLRPHEGYLVYVLLIRHGFNGS